MRLPRRGVMLADPALSVAELIEPANDLQVPFMSVLEAALGWMRRHGEISDLHLFLLWLLLEVIAQPLGRQRKPERAHYLIVDIKRLDDRNGVWQPPGNQGRKQDQ